MVVNFSSFEILTILYVVILRIWAGPTYGILILSKEEKLTIIFCPLRLEAILLLNKAQAIWTVILYSILLRGTSRLVDAGTWNYYPRSSVI